MCGNSHMFFNQCAYFRNHRGRKINQNSRKFYQKLMSFNQKSLRINLKSTDESSFSLSHSALNDQHFSQRTHGNTISEKKILFSFYFTARLNFVERAVDFCWPRGENFLTARWNEIFTRFPAFSLGVIVLPGRSVLPSTAYTRRYIKKIRYRFIYNADFSEHQQ